MVKKKQKTMIEQLEGEVIKGAEELIKGTIKRKIIRIGEISVLIFMAFVMISFGLGQLIAFYMPILANGLSFMILGVLFLLISFIM
jgi:hypothetical protein